MARFCQFAESLGALILGYDGLKLSSNTQLDSTHATKVLTALSTFDVKDVDDLYKKFNFKQNGFYKILFGYDILDNNYGNQISLSLKNIEKSLKEISDCYIFFKNRIMHINMDINFGWEKNMIRSGYFSK